MCLVTTFDIWHSQAKCIVMTAVCPCVYLCVCVCVCVCLPRRIPTVLHIPGCNFWAMVEGAPYSFAILGGFACNRCTGFVVMTTNAPMRNVREDVDGCTGCMAGSCTARSAHHVVFDRVEATRSRVIGFASIALMSCLLVLVIILDVHTLPKSARPRCRRLATRQPVSL